MVRVESDSPSETGRESLVKREDAEIQNNRSGKSEISAIKSLRVVITFAYLNFEDEKNYLLVIIEQDVSSPQIALLLQCAFLCVFCTL